MGLSPDTRGYRVSHLTHCGRVVKEHTQRWVEGNPERDFGEAS